MILVHRVTLEVLGERRDAEPLHHRPGALLTAPEPGGTQIEGCALPQQATTRTAPRLEHRHSSTASHDGVGDRQPTHPGTDDEHVRFESHGAGQPLVSGGKQVVNAEQRLRLVVARMLSRHRQVSCQAARPLSPRRITDPGGIRPRLRPLVGHFECLPPSLVSITVLERPRDDDLVAAASSHPSSTNSYS